MLSADPEKEEAEAEDSSLVRPLIEEEKIDYEQNLKMSKEADENPSFSSTTSLAVDTTRTNKARNGKYTDYMAGRIYASNAPKILLETITARTATIVISLTYLFFIIGFCVDFYTTYRSFHSSNYQLGATPCDQTRQVITNNNRIWSCSSGKYWNSTVTNLNNVISVSLSVQQNNITSLVDNATDTFSIFANIGLWTCYEEMGCRHNFAKNDYYTSNPGVWQRVLIQNDKQIDINLARDTHTVNDLLQLDISLIPSTFQNQEAIPTNGLVKSYFISIEYQQNPYNLFQEEKNNSWHYTTYNFDVVERPRTLAVNAMTIVLMFVTLVVLASYSIMLYHQKKVLSEQKWVVAYFVLLVLFQNPVYAVIVFFKQPPSVSAAYTSYIIGYIAQSGLFMLWLLFADSVLRKTSTKASFYLPKLFIGLTILTFGVLILTFQFPGVSPKGNHPRRSAVEAVANWSPELKNDFIGFTFCYLLLIWVWTILWFVRLYLTGRTLKKLPYMSTRYIQLSYRFFSLQATLVTLYYVFQYVVVIIFITQGVSSSYDTTTLTDNINILFRQQTQLFGKELFLTVYALIIAFLFLPSDLMDSSGGLLASLRATYVISEDEHYGLVRSRQRTIRNMKKNQVYQLTLMNQLVNARPDVFCVDMALSLRSLAFQAYYDPPNFKTLSGYDGAMKLEKIGYEMIDLNYNPEHEVFCYIARETLTGRLVVCFRGTASKRQMEDNLKYNQKSIVFNSLRTDSLDQLDGLTIKEEFHDDWEMESVDEDEEEDLNMDSTHHSMSAEQSGSHGRPSNDPAGGRETMAEGVGAVGGGIRRVMEGAAGVTQAVVDVAGTVTGAVVDATGGLVATAAYNTPVLKNIVQVNVHCGFWEAYEQVRDFIHAVLRRELIKNPTTVIFTGHSLGGALATFSALDVTLNTLPRVHAYLKHQEKLRYKAAMAEKDPASGLDQMEGGGTRNSLFTKFSRTLTGFAGSTFLPRTSTTTSSNDPSSRLSQSVDSQASARPKYIKKIKVYMYNFGSPRVGNGNFANFYDKTVPNSYRVVVDGDIVAALPPPTRYTHIGTEILIDSVGAGSIIIDPSFVERWLRTHIKSSVTVHSLLVYRKGLLGIKLAAEFMRDHAKEMTGRDNVDPLRLALKVRAHSQVDSILDENAGIAADLVDATKGDLDDNEEGGASDPSMGNKIAGMAAGIMATSTGTAVGAPHDEGAESPASDIELMPSPAPSGRSSPSTSMATSSNPLLKAIIQDAMDAGPSQVVSRGRNGGVYPTGGGESVNAAAVQEADLSLQNRAALHAAHYAHDVENMDALMQQMTAKKVPGPVKWVTSTVSTTASSAGKQFARATSPMVGTLMRRASSQPPDGSETPSPKRHLAEEKAENRILDDTMV